jgi:arsenite methyltransferase
MTGASIGRHVLREILSAHRRARRCQTGRVIDSQFARPRGMLGRVVGRMMARRNATLTRRTIAALHLRGDETVVEIGPGPGVGLLLLAQSLPHGRVIGAEPSPAMRAQASSRTRNFRDRVRLLDATADSLSLPAASIDAIYAINSVQLWQPLPSSLAVVHDLLRPGGTLALGLTENAVLPGGGCVGRGYDTSLLPHLRGAGFDVTTAVWQPGGNGHELVLLAQRRPS